MTDKELLDEIEREFGSHPPAPKNDADDLDAFLADLKQAIAPESQAAPTKKDTGHSLPPASPAKKEKQKAPKKEAREKAPKAAAPKKKEKQKGINTKFLFKYFAQSLERELSSEEKAIIKTAYKFGRNNTYDL